MKRSFACAFRGLFLPFCRERNLRIHSAVAAQVIFFGVLAELETWGWALCLLSMGLVFALELVNCALERLCDRVSRDREPSIRDIKDIAAGAVLIAAFGAAGAGLMVFLRGSVLNTIGDALTPGLWAAEVVLLFVSALWIRGRACWKVERPMN